MLMSIPCIDRARRAGPSQPMRPVLVSRVHSSRSCAACRIDESAAATDWHAQMSRYACARDEQLRESATTGSSGSGVARLPQLPAHRRRGRHDGRWQCQGADPSVWSYRAIAAVVAGPVLLVAREAGTQPLAASAVVGWAFMVVVLPGARLGVAGKTNLADAGLLPTACGAMVAHPTSVS
jgi:hypothetical protein